MIALLALAIWIGGSRSLISINIHLLLYITTELYVHAKCVRPCATHEHGNMLLLPL